MKADAKTQIIYNDNAVNIAAKYSVYNGANYIYVWADNLPLPASPADVVSVKAASTDQVLISAAGPDTPPIEWDFDEYYSASIANAAPLAENMVPRLLEAVILYINGTGVHYIHNAPVTTSISGTVTVGNITSTGFEIQDTHDGYMTALTNDPTITGFAVQIYYKG